jgi:hypothetical protein
MIVSASASPPSHGHRSSANKSSFMSGPGAASSWVIGSVKARRASAGESSRCSRWMRWLISSMALAGSGECGVVSGIHADRESIHGLARSRQLLELRDQLRHLLPEL